MGNLCSIHLTSPSRLTGSGAGGRFVPAQPQTVGVGGQVHYHGERVPCQQLTPSVITSWPRFHPLFGHTLLQWLHRMKDANAGTTWFYLALQPIKLKLPGAQIVIADFFSCSQGVGHEQEWSEGSPVKVGQLGSGDVWRGVVDGSGGVMQKVQGVVLGEAGLQSRRA